MAILVQKYGGTSVGSVERIARIADKVIRARAAGHSLVVVLSAMGKTTDALAQMARSLADTPDPREEDMLLSTGEQISIALLCMALQQKGVDAVSLTGWQAGIRTDAVHGNARIVSVDTSPIRKHLARGSVVVVAGYQGVTAAGEITTLGRGGSDTTAVALAAHLQAQRCEIYTDVTGVYTADPRIVPTARKLSRISYHDMLELARLGAGVLHPRSVETAREGNVPLIVRSSFSDEEGTLIEAAANDMQDLPVRGIAHQHNVAVISACGEQADVGADKIVGTLADEGIELEPLPLQDETHALSFVLTGEKLPKALAVLEANKAKLRLSEVKGKPRLASISIVGVKQPGKAHLARRISEVLRQKRVAVHHLHQSGRRISCYIPAANTETAVRSLHDAFCLG